MEGEFEPPVLPWPSPTLLSSFCPPCTYNAISCETCLMQKSENDEQYLDTFTVVKKALDFTCHRFS